MSKKAFKVGSSLSFISSPKFAKILTHIDDKYHRKKVGKHLHKNAPLKIDDEGLIVN